MSDSQGSYQAEQKSDRPITWDDIPQVEDACRTALGAPALDHLTMRLGRDVDAWTELAKVRSSVESVAHLLRLQQSSGADPVDLARWLLLRASLAALPQLPSWRVYHSVKRLWLEEVMYFARPTGNLSYFAPSHVRFQEMARIVTFRRYPGGQFHWEVTGFPISWILRARPSDWGAVLSTLIRMGGRQPLVDTHINERRKNRPVLTESEGVRSYYRLAKSIELRPEICGLLSCSWLYCAQTGEVSPHLAWLRNFFLDRGAVVADVGPAPQDSGFKIGSALRRKLYEEGRYRPRMTYILWARADILQWAAAAALETTDPRI